MENDTLDVASLPLFIQLAHPQQPKHLWYGATNIRGKGKEKFLATLSGHHCCEGRQRVYRTRPDKWGEPQEGKGYRYHRVVSPLAIKVWEDPEQRKKWLTHHKAISRLIG